MLPGVSTRVLVVNDPIPPTMVPYIDPPLAPSPWQATHCAAYKALPSATLPLPLGSPLPSEVRMSIFQAAMSASVIGLPKRGVGPLDCASADSSASDENSSSASAPANLSDRIFHLPACADRPGKDSVVVLHEAHERASFCDLRHSGLHVAGAIDGAAGDLGRPAVPLPDVAEAGEAAVEERLLEHRLAPAFAAVERHVHGLNGSVAGPGEALDRVDARSAELHPPEGRVMTDLHSMTKLNC